jgi:EAL domain-containing protein (putative c-di-GMP-specific phosphodiesterase class I)
VIPEGIETEDQLAKLTELGCGFGQGFLFSRPVEAPEIERMLTAGLAVA